MPDIEELIYWLQPLQIDPDRLRRLKRFNGHVAALDLINEGVCHDDDDDDDFNTLYVCKMMIMMMQLAIIKIMMMQITTHYSNREALRSVIGARHHTGAD